MTAFPDSAFRRYATSWPGTPKWELNPAHTPWWAARVARWPVLFARKKKWRKLIAYGRPPEFLYATDEELARIRLEEEFGETRSEATSPV